MSSPTSPPAWLEAAARQIPDLDAEGEEVALPKPAPAPKAKSRLPAEPIVELPDNPSISPPASSPAKPSSRLPAPGLPAPASKPIREETDLAWRGCHPVTMIPGVLISTAITAAAIVYLRSLVPARFVQECVDFPLLALWLLQVIRLGYRSFAYEYRLTTRRLFRSRGKLYPRDEPLELARVTKVELLPSPLCRCLGVGSLRIESEEGVPPMDLDGLFRPRSFKTLLEHAVESARDANVTKLTLHTNPV